ncbi:hypothetical protein [Nitrosophilus labii]|uniref:hypothetical protein n=1 Tax=Nitrosophilus labii TaxID=2706014 RepID=UPI0016570D2E|nr:hypothetical protein [Nitrosophilus labii]
MKKITLSFVAAALAASVASASTITLYQDKDTGAIYTKPGPNRVELGDFVSAKEVYVQNETIKSKMSKALKGTKVKSKVKTLKFSGKHYLGYTFTNDKTSANKDNSEFETRRNYLQVKAYWNKKDYMRLTLDTFQNVNETDGKDKNSWEVRVKYAYIYLDNILPYTGVEFGQVHRTWIDWEEHHGWLYRSISKTFIEDSTAADLTNSADLGINFKTKMDYFSSEIGVFNGEGYHGDHSGTEMSYEWRLTANILGTGKKHVHPTENEYFDLSFTGQYNNDNNYKPADSKGTPSIKKWWGIHAVYNQPMFLIAGMYVDSSSSTYNKGKGRGTGYTINGEFRPAKKWSVLGRYDYWKIENDAYSHAGEDKSQYLAGLAYKYNKNVKFIGNIKSYDAEDIDGKKATQYMFTAEVKW